MNILKLNLKSKCKSLTASLVIITSFQYLLWESVFYTGQPDVGAANVTRKAPGTGWHLLEDIKIVENATAQILETFKQRRIHIRNICQKNKVLTSNSRESWDSFKQSLREDNIGKRLRSKDSSERYPKSLTLPV